MIANDIMKDGFVLDEQLDDIEQHLYLINKIACIQIKELDVAIKKIEKSLENSNNIQR